VKREKSKESSISDSKNKKGIPIQILTAIIAAVGVVCAAIINGVFSLHQANIPVRATMTAEARATRVAATIQAGEQGPEKRVYTLSVHLPGGHTPPNSPNGVRPKPEIYEKLPVRIQIPAIGVDAPVVQGDDWIALKKGVGQMLGTSYPGEGGVIILSGYNDIFGEVFRYLDRLREGDKVILYTQTAQYVYTVEHLEFVSDPELEIKIDPNRPQLLVLTSPHPYLRDTDWVVVYAYLTT